MLRQLLESAAEHADTYERLVDPYESQEDSMDIEACLATTVPGAERWQLIEFARWKRDPTRRNRNNKPVTRDQ